jgi:ABC-type branched-subunit amino acid transport system substrate-binding protein
MRRFITILIVLVLIGGSLPIASSCTKTSPFKIGVLLPLSGPDAVDSTEVLDWAKDNVNFEGGINNRRIELIYKDTYGNNIKELAQQFIDDKSINIVIGPGSSSDVYEIAPLFIDSKKLLISPMSTAGDIFRAFGKQQYFWRTCQSDVAQVRLILYHLSMLGVNNISLVYEDTVYGKTFFDWTGFFATELGINLAGIVSFEPGQSDFSGVIEQALESNPEYIIAAAFPQDAVSIKEELDKTDNWVKLFFSDAAESEYVIETLGNEAEGLEGITPSADPATGFESVYRQTFGHIPSNFAAATYDAFMMAIYTLARQEYCGNGPLWFGGEDIAESLQNVISGEEGTIGWDTQGMKKGIDDILSGKLPDINGASGSLDFDDEFGVDPVATYYTRWVIEDGNFQMAETLSSWISSDIGIGIEGTSAYRTQGSAKFAEIDGSGTVSYIPEEKEDSWAVIIATSEGWENYRHQAGALAMYDMLKNNGFADDKIILFVADDIADSEDNPLKGNVHYTIGGKNLHENTEIDYSGEQVTLDNLINVLLGNQTDETTDVLETTGKSNIFIYIVDHGLNGSILFKNGDDLTAQKLADTIDSMQADLRYRQIFIVIEACYGESMAKYLDNPGVILITGAAANENSLGYEYDSRIKAWLADDFSSHFISTVSAEPDLSILDLYTMVYGKVSGSHVKLCNYINFGNISTTSIAEFVSP